MKNLMLKFPKILVFSSRKRKKNIATISFIYMNIKFMDKNANCLTFWALAFELFMLTASVRRIT